MPPHASQATLHIHASLELCDGCGENFEEVIKWWLAPVLADSSHCYVDIEDKCNQV